MRSYLSLIPISAKVHKRQNRMTLLCIIIAVFLVNRCFLHGRYGGKNGNGTLETKAGKLAYYAE